MASKPRIIVDTGPLVAFLHADDFHHQWTLLQFKRFPAPFLTCEAVLAETAFIVARDGEGLRRFFELLALDVVEVNFSLAAEHPALSRLTMKYRDLPMSLADACLVRMAEQNPEASVLTLDSHFRVYRRNGRQAISVLMPTVAE